MNRYLKERLDFMDREEACEEASILKHNIDSFLKLYPSFPKVNPSIRKFVIEMSKEYWYLKGRIR